MLRSNILQPSTDSGLIKARYDTVEELITKPDIMTRLKQNLFLFKDLEIQITKFIHQIDDVSESMIKQLLYGVSSIRICLLNMENIRNTLKGQVVTDILVEISEDFNKNIYSEFLSEIEKYVGEYDLTQESFKQIRKADSILFMIREGLDNTLDIMRKTYIDTIDVIYSEYEKIKSEVDDPNLKLLYSESIGYYVIVGERYFNPDVFPFYKKTGKKYQCSNNALSSLSERVKEIKKDLLNFSISKLIELIKLLQKHITHLQDLSSNIATLDMLCAFAEYSKNLLTWTKPTIKKSSETSNGVKSNIIQIKDSRFPLDIGINDPNFLVPNDYYLINNFNILMIKGANASGKTTYMKQLALLIILAQIGCFVPAESFIYNPVKFIYTKFEHNDSVEERTGSFSKEIVELQKILYNNSNCSSNSSNSLILLDEPFDSKNSVDSYSLIWSIVEYFSINLSNSFVIISSHNKIFQEFTQFYFNIMGGTMEVEFSEDCLDFKHKFKIDNPLYLCEDKDEKEISNETYENNY